jgi:PhnB protein
MSNTTVIQPWLYVKDSIKAFEFYKQAFGAIETYRLDVPDGVIAKLSVDAAEFWISEESTESPGPKSIGGHTARMILVVADPDPLFAQALKAGATEIFPIGEGHGWRLGRIVDPFGHHWEIGHPI